MINFPCQCGAALSVPTDLAGELIQCPDCKRLNDVPLTSEFAQIDADGSYKLDDVPAIPVNDPRRIDDAVRAFTREHYDRQGVEIDYRGLAAEPAGDGEIPLEPDAPAYVPPRYDPITGELIRALEVKPDDHVQPSALPTARRAAAKAFDERPTIADSALLPARLCTPINLMVMSFLLFAHLVGAGMMFAIATYYWPLTFFWIILQLLMLSYFGVLVDELGPSERDELPTPLRSLDFHEDTFGPMLRVMLALGVTLLPGLLVLFTLRGIPLPVVLGISLILLAAGIVFFPAVVLTTLTSGTILNLRPDRVLAVMAACGSEYLLSLGLWIIGGPVYIASVVAVNLLAFDVFRPRPLLPSTVRWPIAYAALAGAIFLMHLFCWHLGLLYRRHHMSFPWVLQRWNRGAGPAEPTGFAVERTIRRRGKKQPVMRALPVEKDARFEFRQ